MMMMILKRTADEGMVVALLPIRLLTDQKSTFMKGRIPGRISKIQVL